MKHKILLTRPIKSSERWASLLKARGIECVIEPLLTIEPTDNPRPDGVFQAIILTSPNALENAKLPLGDLLPLPCFCVGATTAEAARAYGFTDVKYGTTDSAALAALIMATLTYKHAPLLHIAGDRVEGKGRDILTQHGFTVTPWVVYHAHTAEDFTTSTRARFAAADFTTIPVFSPHSAHTLVSIIEKNGLSPACSRLTAIALSQTVANVLQSLPWQRLRIAATPAEEDVLACLQQEFSMTQNEVVPPPPSCKRKKSCFVWSLLGVVLIAGAGVSAYVHCPWFQPTYPVTQNFAPEIAALEKRIDTLETQIGAQNSIAATPAPIPSDALNAAVTDALKNIQTQIQSSGNHDLKATRQRIAETVAFFELHETANRDTSFTSQLDILLATASGDTAVREQAEKLAIYAAHPTPPLSQLRTELLAQEASLTLPPPPEETASFWSRIKTIFHPLVSVHPLHDTHFASLETTLESGDTQAALESFKALPDDTQKSLASWHDKLAARAAIDSALQGLSAIFTAPVQDGTEEKTP